MKTELLKKLNERFPTAEFTAAANRGDWMGAAEKSAGLAWGIWQECREAAGLSDHEAARSAWIAAQAAERKACFKNKR